MNPKIKAIFAQWLLAAVLLSLAGCFSEEANSPAVLRVGVLPDQDAAVLERRYAPLMAYLQEQVDLDVQLIVPASYRDLVHQFGAREVDLALFGGTTFVASQVRHDAVPLVMRDIDLEFTSYFVAAAGEPATSLEDFRGRRFSFGARTSTSGHLMPRYFMQQRGIEAESFFSEVQYSGGHDRTIELVLEGATDLGAVNAEVFRGMQSDGRIKPGAVRIVWETPPYADYVWAVQPELDRDTRLQLRDAFLALTSLNATDAVVLKNLGAAGFLPARKEDFADMTEIIAGSPLFDDLVETRGK